MRLVVSLAALFLIVHAANGVGHQHDGSDSSQPAVNTQLDASSPRFRSLRASSHNEALRASQRRVLNHMHVEMMDSVERKKKKRGDNDKYDPQRPKDLFTVLQHTCGVLTKHNITHWIEYGLIACHCFAHLIAVTPFLSLLCVVIALVIHCSQLWHRVGRLS